MLPSGGAFVRIISPKTLKTFRTFRVSRGGMLLCRPHRWLTHRVTPLITPLFPLRVIVFLT